MDNIERFADLDDSAAVVGTASSLVKRAYSASESQDQGHTMRGRLNTPIDLFRFILAGNATLTLVSKKSGARFTYKFQRPDPEPGRRRPIFVKVLSGADNENNYAFVGTIWPDAAAWTYKHSFKSRVTQSAPSVVAVQWMLKHLNVGGDALLLQAEVWHEGRCGRCGRKLTVPSSIESGFGPECITKI